MLLLLGAQPVEAELHKRSLSLLYSILTCQNSKMIEILNRHISTNFDNKKKYFARIIEILEKYHLPKIEQLQNNIPKKDSWKSTVKEKIDQYWNEKLRDDATNKSSLKFLNLQIMEAK